MAAMQSSFAQPAVEDARLERFAKRNDDGVQDEEDEVGKRFPNTVEMRRKKRAMTGHQCRFRLCCPEQVNSQYRGSSEGEKGYGRVKYFELPALV